MTLTLCVVLYIYLYHYLLVFPNVKVEYELYVNLMKINRHNE